MLDSISSIAGRIAAIDERARRLNVAWGTDTTPAGTPAASDPSTGPTPPASGTTGSGTVTASAGTFAAAMADTTTSTTARSTSRAHAAARTTTAHAAPAALDSQLGALKGGGRHAATVASATATARSAASAAPARAATPASASAAATPAPAAAASPTAPAAGASAATTVTTSGTVAASDDTAAAPAIDPALGSGGYRSAAAWDPSGPVGQLIAKYGINKGTYIELGPPAAVAGRGASAEELKILAGSGAFGSPGTYQGLDYSYFSGVSGTTGVDKLADGTPVAAGMCVWTVWKNGEIVHQEVGSPNMDSTQLSIKYLGYA